MLSRTTSAPRTNGASCLARLSGSELIPNRRRSVSAAARAHLGSRLDPRVTSPPAQSRIGRLGTCPFALAATTIRTKDLASATGAVSNRRYRRIICQQPIPRCRCLIGSETPSTPRPFGCSLVGRRVPHPSRPVPAAGVARSCNLLFVHGLERASGRHGPFISDPSSQAILHPFPPHETAPWTSSANHPRRPRRLSERASA